MRPALWRQIGTGPSLMHMSHGCPTSRFSRIHLLLLSIVYASVPKVAAAQDHWTGVGAIAGTAMFMDTTTIVRAGPVREVWIKSLDSSPRTLVAGHDSVSFDTVIGLNVFDCARKTRVVTTVRYLLGDEVVFDVAETRDKPASLRPKSFFAAIYDDLCGSPR
jgi:hypothetical protein